MLPIFSRLLWKLKTAMQENKSRYSTYFWISLWKIALFLAYFLGLNAAFHTSSSGGEGTKSLFNDFSSSFTGNGYNMVLTNGTIEEENIAPGNNYMPARYLVLQLGCSYATYIFGKFACKVNIQLEAFALPMMLVAPAAVSGMITMCKYRADDPCALTGFMPDYIFYQVGTKLNVISHYKQILA